MRYEERRKLDANQRLFNTEQLMKYLQIGRNKAREIGKESGAAVRLGKNLLFDKAIIDNYIDSILINKSQK